MGVLKLQAGCFIWYNLFNNYNKMTKTNEINPLYLNQMTIFDILITTYVYLLTLKCTNTVLNLNMSDFFFQIKKKYIE